MDLNLSLHDKIPLGSSIVDSCVQNLILVFKRLQKPETRSISYKDIYFILYHDLSPLCLKNLKKNLVFENWYLLFLPSMKSDQIVFQRNRQSMIIRSTIDVTEIAWISINNCFDQRKLMQKVFGCYWTSLTPNEQEDTNISACFFLE
jgi:hypothetical protein